MAHNTSKMRNFKFDLAFLITFMTLLNPTAAFFRHLCHGTLAIGRYDPLMSPGTIAQHVHNVKGASNFGFDTNYTHLQASNCTSCAIKQDKSAYWTPYLYFRHTNGTFELVPEDGGLTAYYFTERPDVGSEITPFPSGFRMIAGNSMKRTFYGPIPDPDMSNWTWSDMTQQAIMEKSIGFNCLKLNGPTEGSLMRHEMPTKEFIDTNCDAGVRAELQFPSCWDGKNLDSANHTTHVAYASRLRNGDCPPGYPVRLPVLFFETIYWTPQFNNIPGQYVYANGDPTGNGYHGDFINGWDEGVMQQVLDTPNCTGADASSGQEQDCPIFDLKGINSPEVMDCQIETPNVLQAEQVNMVQMLPGGVPVQLGPGPASPWVVPHSAMPTAIDQEMGSVEWVTSSTSAHNGSAAASSSTATAVNQTDASSAQTTPAPTTPPAIDYSTWTSITTSDGTVFNWVVVEEVVTTTVTGAAPSGAVKRHLEHHRHFGRV